MKTRKPRLKKCATCGGIFRPERPLQPCCSISCAIEKTNKDLKRKKKRELARRRKGTMSMKERQAKARKAAQEYARLRDIKWFKDRGELPKCIMCGTDSPKSWHGCHFVAVGSKGGPRSFHPANINLGCGQCNFFADQGSTQYRENMIIKYGIEIVEYLEAYPLDFTLTAEEVDEIEEYYKKLCKDIKNELRELR